MSPKQANHTIVSWKIFLTALFLLMFTACQPKQLLPLRVETIEDDLAFPVAMAFAPDGRLFYALQNGQIFTKEVLPRGSTEAPSIPLIESLAVAAGNESGLLGLALAQDFDQSGHFFIYYTVPDAKGAPSSGRIVRFTESDGAAVDETIIVDDLPARAQQFYHFGGGLTIGPDNKLYLIFGDTNLPEQARTPDALPGSILRYNLDGTIPEDNPFPGSPVFAFGIRNGFGLAFHPETEILYETENGERCDDELNLIKAGADYGWGVHAYDRCPYPDDHARAPLYQWTPTISPAGLSFYMGDVVRELKGNLLLCGFNTSNLYAIELGRSGNEVQAISVVEAGLREDLCRIAVVEGPDGWIYTSTDRSILRIGR